METQQADSALTAEEYQLLADDLVERFGLDDDDLVIAVKSGEGTLLKRLLEEGIQVLGIEPDQDLAFDATSAGIETIPKSLTPDVATQVVSSHGRATLIVAPLETVYPEIVISSAATLLAPHGVLVLDANSHVELASLNSHLAECGLQAFTVERTTHTVRIFADRGHRT